MTTAELIKELGKFPPDTPVCVKEKVLNNDDGFVHHSWEWVNLEKKHITKPTIGNKVYIGSL